MNIYIVASSDQFIRPIIREWERDGHKCHVDAVLTEGNATTADVIWCEWGDKNAIAVQEFLTPAKKILRIHAYEVYSGIVPEIIAEEWDAIIFVSKHMKEEFCRTAGKEPSNTYIVSNLIDINGLVTSKPKERNNKIAYAGYLCRKKGIGELLLLAGALPDYQFVIAGEIQEGDYLNFFGADKPDNVYFENWQDDMASFYADKTYVISASLREAFSVALAEGVLCGCVPLVRNWLGARDIYPGYIWSNLDELKELLKKEMSPDWISDFVARNRLDKVMDDLDYLLSKDKAERPMESLTIGIVQTREKYLPRLLQSIKLQNYPIKIDILSNVDKDMSIGKAYNVLAQRCDTDWICYIGDDDWMSEDYIYSVMRAYSERMYKYKNIIALLTGSIIHDGASNMQVTDAHPTGFWRADFVREHPFDETLVRQVDTYYFREIDKHAAGCTIIKLPWINGYYYRQHTNNISGNKFKEGAITHQEKV